MQVNDVRQIIYPQNIKNTLAQFMEFDLRQEVTIIKLHHLVFVLKQQISNITKIFHQELKLKQS